MNQKGERKLKKTNTQKGITLIALIITIVVLLILAVVAISSIQNDGILGHAQNAAETYNHAVKNEQDALGKYEEFLNKYNGGTTTYKEYKIGDEVKVVKDGGEHEFYVIKDSASTEENVVLLAKEAIDIIDLVQVPSDTGIGKAFSETNYWADTATSYPYNLNETGIPDESHYALRAAYDYGTKLGGTGRLLSYDEATKILDYEFMPLNYYGDFWWLGAASDSDMVWFYESENTRLDCAQFYTDVEQQYAFLVRPVVTISKSKVFEYKIGDEVKVVKDGVEHEFYVIKDSASTEENVVLLSKQAIDATNLEQVSGNGWEYSGVSIAFSKTAYWADTATSYPFDLTENGVPDESHKAARAAYDYGAKLGGTGRLLSYDEATKILDYEFMPLEDGVDLWWLGTAENSDGDVWCVTSQEEGFSSAPYNITSVAGQDWLVRPVVTISKSLLS